MTQPGKAPDDGVRERQQQIAANLRALILSGDLRAGERLPSTADLMAQYGVSDKTVQRALSILKAERFVEGRAGVGVFVTAHQPAVMHSSHYPIPADKGQPYPWITEHVSRGHTAKSDLRLVGEVPAPAEVAAAYELDLGTPVVVRHQLLKLDNEPAELVWSYYRTDMARGTQLAEPRKIKGGTPVVLAALGYPLRNAVDLVLTRLATVDEFTALQLPEDMPVLRQFRVVYSDHQQPVEVTVMVKAGQKYQIQYDLPEQ
jgi:GntR family transcriptional regulator